MNLQIHKKLDSEICRHSEGRPQLGSGLRDTRSNRHFYVYKPPRPLEQIERKIPALEGDIASVLMGSLHERE